jgi:rod shape determining protein RodA
MKLIFLPAVFLSLLGLVMLVSISPERVLLQSIFLIAAVLVGLACFKIGAKNLLPVVWPLYIAILIVLGLTFIFGAVTRGSIRWLSFGGVKFQASEFAKPILMLATAHFFSANWRGDKKSQLKAFTKVAAAGLLLILVAIQPDLGTAISLLAILMSVMIISGIPKLLLVLGILSIVVLMPFGKVILKDYQVRRLESFVNPYSDPRGAGYQVIQSTIAVGSGMWTGRGLGRGTQSQLKFLPERHTDFIFASLVEELGFLGGVVVLGLYAAMITGLIRAAWATNDRVDRLVLGSTAGWLFFQSAINIMMNLGLSPVTGITLPFLSSGGSSMVSSSIILGLSLSVIKR